MDAFALLAEQKIKAAIRDGAFDKLPFHGKPLQLDADASVPAVLRMSFQVLRNAGILPEEMRLKKELSELQQTLRETADETTRRHLQMQVSMLETRYQLLIARHRRSY